MRLRAVGCIDQRAEGDTDPYPSARFLICILHATGGFILPRYLTAQGLFDRIE
jgi:hypothetical protein